MTIAFGFDLNERFYLLKQSECQNSRPFGIARVFLLDKKFCNFFKAVQDLVFELFCTVNLVLLVQARLLLQTEK